MVFLMNENKSKIKVKTGDLVINVLQKVTFLVTSSTGRNVELLMINAKSAEPKTFKMLKNRFIEQLTSDRAIEELRYFPVKSSK